MPILLRQLSVHRAARTRAARLKYQRKNATHHGGERTVMLPSPQLGATIIIIIIASAQTDKEAAIPWMSQPPPPLPSSKCCITALNGSIPLPDDFGRASSRARARSNNSLP